MANEIIHVQFGEVFKFNKQSDGSLQVFGKATNDTLDGDLQKCDLAWSSKAMEKWLSTGANMRVQHNPSLYPAGVGMSVDSKPDGVYLMAEIAEATAIRLVEKGALRAFSVGISHPKFARDATAPNGRIVGGDIVEVSLVDRPSNPDCAFTVKMAGKGDEAHFEGEYTRLPEISSPLNKLMNSIVTKGTNSGSDDNDPDDGGDSVDESDAGDNANNGDGGQDQDADSDGDGTPDDQESDTHGDDGDDGKDGADGKDGDDGADGKDGKDGKDAKSKEAEPDTTKDDVSDDGGADCTTCKGKGTIMAGNRKCPKCNGSGKAKDAKADKSAQDFDGDTDGGPDTTDPADDPDDGVDLDTDGDGDSTDSDDVGPDDDSDGGNGTDTSDDDSQVDEIVEELEAELGGGDGADDPGDLENLDTDNKLQQAWSERGHAKLNINDEEQRIRTAAKALSIAGPWDEPGDGQKTRFADWAMRRLHDTTCPVYSNEALKHAYPSLAKGIDAATGKTAQQIIYGMLRDCITADGGEGNKTYDIVGLAKAYNGVCSSVLSTVYDEARASLGLDKTLTPGDIAEAARNSMRKDAEIDDTDDPGVTVRTKGAHVWYATEPQDAVGKQLQAIHDAVALVQPDLCTLPEATAKPVTKVVEPDLTKAVTVDDRIDEITTAFDAERDLLNAKIEKLSALPDFTLLNTPRRRATGSYTGGVDVAKGLTVTDANDAAQEQERQSRIAWYTDLSKSGATRAEREAAEELLGKLQFPDLTK